jgi:hypothetical protein
VIAQCSPHRPGLEDFPHPVTQFRLFYRDFNHPDDSRWRTTFATRRHFTSCLRNLLRFRLYSLRSRRISHISSYLTLCPTSPSLSWVDWVSLPHSCFRLLFIGGLSVLRSAKTAECPSQVRSLVAPHPIPCFLVFFVSCFISSLYRCE